MKLIHFIIEKLLDWNFLVWLAVFNFLKKGYLLYKSKYHLKVKKVFNLLTIQVKAHYTEILLAILGFTTMLLLADKLSTITIYINNGKEKYVI